MCEVPISVDFDLSGLRLSLEYLIAHCSFDFSFSRFPVRVFLFKKLYCLKSSFFYASEIKSKADYI